MTTNPPQIVFNHIVAFEVSKEKLVVHTLPDNEQWTIDNKPQAVRRLIKAEIKRNRNKQIGQMLVICEATGGYERHVLDGVYHVPLATLDALAHSLLLDPVLRRSARAPCSALMARA
jgi:hypothetical protein